MAMVDYESLVKPVSAEDPCGGDLDLAGDMDYMNFIAGAEGLLPKSYFSKDQSGNEGRPFDRTTIDFAAQFVAAAPFLEKTRDLRLIGILAKLCILNRDLSGFVACVRAMHALLETRWDDVHPRAEDGNYGLRMVAVEAIEAMPTVVLPLQFMPLIEHERLGNLSYRAFLIKKGEVKRTEGEPAVDAAAFERILDEVELPLLVERRQQVKELEAALKQIRAVWIERGGDGPPVTLERLTGAVAGIFGMLNDAILKRDPGTAADGTEEAPAEGEAAAGPPRAVAQVNSSATAGRALAAVAEYFSCNEPSNPALLLVKQAQALLGKSFIEVIQALVPDHLAKAAVNIGKEQYFPLPVQRLSAAVGVAEGAAATANGSGQGDTEVQFEVRSRTEALKLLGQIGRYFSIAEPPSPIPFFTERATDLATRDFLSVLKTMLPADALKTLK